MLPINFTCDENYKNPINFDTKAEIYDKDRNKLYVHKIVETIKNEISEGSILDVGCGTGTLLSMLNPRIAIGIDKSRKMIEIAKNNYPRYIFYNASIEDFKLNKKFDNILLIDVIYYMEDMCKVFLNIMNFCKDDYSTKIVLIFPNEKRVFISNLVRKMGFAIKDFDVKYPTIEQVSDNVKKSGFEIIKAYKSFFRLIWVVTARVKQNGISR